MTVPPPFARFFQREDALHASVLLKRTYDLLGDGSTRLARIQLPLQAESEAAELEHDPTWKGELDLASTKPRTDVVVFGHAHASRPGTTSTLVSVGLPDHDWIMRIRITGDRHCIYRAGRPPDFSSPEPFEAVPLTWGRAYGGADPTVRWPSPPADILSLYRQLARPAGAYPRNPVGCGYVVDNVPDVVQGLRLPNLEDPTDLLTPERIFAGTHEQWHRQPLSTSTGWVDPGWFPRCALAGFMPDFEPPEAIPEVDRGALPSRWKGLHTADRASPRLFNAAPSGLQVPHLQGGERIELANIGAPGRYQFRLPTPPPITVSHRTQKLRVVWVVHTVCIFADEERVGVTWRAEIPPPTGGWGGLNDLRRDGPTNPLALGLTIHVED